MKALFSYPRWIAAAMLALALSACGGGSSSNVSVSGTVTGLTTGSLVLGDGSSYISLDPTISSFTFPAGPLIGAAYAVTIQSQATTTLSCSVANGVGVATGDISVQVTCVPNNSLGGTITGLSTGGLKLANGGDTVSPAANDATFTFPTRVGDGTTYGVTVLQQPNNGLTCSVANGVGRMGTSDVTNVQVTCI